MMDHGNRQFIEQYSAGKAGTRATIENIGGHDYADLLIALGQYGLSLPQPDITGREEQIRRASEVLRPLLSQPHG